MNTQKNILRKLIICIILIGFVFNQSQAQMLQLENENSFLTVFGSSNLHGWKVDANTQNGLIRFNNLESCQIESLSVSVLSESLEGVKPGITESASIALKSNKYKTILFTLVEVKSITDKGNGVFELQTIGDLVIAGTKKSVPLNFDVTIGDYKVKLEGKVKLKMTDFNITPPTGMLGVVEAKDDIFLKFETNFTEIKVL
ncbi:MAG: YceI family protein [Algibacter sp.]|uniref:YceI family protein n=1 Tax=Algibacter sp. TaxID=1872428 RepID=UPI00261ACA64|nr:YceI family protein [Algibacter sp.]MDG1729887.1 YceI family protein [Algibacter sp.]MDG2178965.1 YceI family protein [Algibacter sp.]